jgi:hypothetical protein
MRCGSEPGTPTGTTNATKTETPAPRTQSGSSVCRFRRLCLACEISEVCGEPGHVGLETEVGPGERELLFCP